MADLTSLGVHTPVALPYLIAEGLLPRDPASDLYSWTTSVYSDRGHSVEDQLLWTKDCVVYSQGTLVRNVYRFHQEGENVSQALLTRFETTSAFHTDSNAPNNPDCKRRIHNGYGSSDRRSRPAASQPLCAATLDRAVVIILKTKIHIHFLHGPDHIVDVPFEVAGAFAAPRGIVLEKKAALPASPGPTPQVPAAPPNSFFSSQIRPTSSYLQSPTLVKSFAASQTFKPSPLGGNNRLEALFQNVFGSGDDNADSELASLYTLTKPLSDFGVITYSVQHHRPRMSSKAASGLSIEFDALDAAERIVYVSPSDELENDSVDDRGSLTLLVTANDDTRTLTLWHAWYVDEQYLATLLKQRAAAKAAKAKRRSSFMNTNVTTGTATPGVRTRDGARESFAAAGSIRLQGDAGVGNAVPSSRKQTRKEEEVQMAHQMDPDFQPTASQQTTARENRRISSLNADARAGQHTSTSFATQAGRRNTSFGGPGERRSIGHRKSRGSTPGSVFSRSLDPGDDLMELDSSFDVENEDNIDAIVRHIRATHEAAGADGVFGGTDDNFKREMVIQKIHSLTVSFGAATDQEQSPFQVVTMREPLHSRNSEQQCLGVYILDRTSQGLVCLQINVRYRLLWPRAPNVRVAIPTFSNEINLGKSDDLVKLRDREVTVVLTESGIFTSPSETLPCPVYCAAPYRANDSLVHLSANAEIDPEHGRNRILGDHPTSAFARANAGQFGRYDETRPDSAHHRRQMKLSPSDHIVETLIRVCQLVLPPPQAQTMIGAWMLAHARLVKDQQFWMGTNVDVELMAFATTIFVFVGHFVESKELATLNVARLAAGKSTSVRFSHISHQRALQQQSLRVPWSYGCRFQGGQELSEKTNSDGVDHGLSLAALLADELVRSIPWLSASVSLQLSAEETAVLMLALHIFLQELKLCALASQNHGDFITAMTAQLGGLLGLKAWSFGGDHFSLEGADEGRWAFLKSAIGAEVHLPLMNDPVSVFTWFEHAMRYHSTERYPSLADIVGASSPVPMGTEHAAALAELTPRIVSLSEMLVATACFTASPPRTIELITQSGIGPNILETFPGAIAAPFRAAVAQCEREPPTAWSSALLKLVGRNDLDLDHFKHQEPAGSFSRATNNGSLPIRDVHALCSALDQQPHAAKTKEATRHAISQLIFNEDRRLVDAISLMHYNSPQTAECPRQPDWSDAHHFEQQRRVLQWATNRMIALPSGDGMLHLDSQTPLLTEKYHLSGFSNACVMQPMGHTLTADRSGLTEEKVNWAYFHAGVSAGLRITKSARGIDTSWIAFNKPHDLTNRHAGLLLALGLRGHLRHLAKWLSFKYLTPKHTVTSVGLLLGLSASYMGTMDGLITRMLSVHITRMLPPGAAELNVSAITQTAGLMGIGLLYYNSQHRRMSEIMLSEVEHMELEDPDSGPDPLRDESYRLAAGFALGFINLGKGENLRGLSGMHLPERLLAVAVGSRPVGAVHVFDRATAGAIMAIALVYMKSEDRSIARKIDIPDTEAQFDHVRPDMLLLRAMARHIILWRGIQTSASPDESPSFVQRNLPPCYQGRLNASTAKLPLKSSDVPFFNIVTGLVLALSLKYAGSGDETARDEILAVLDYFYKAKGSADASFYYDAKLTRSTVRRCIDVVALAAATVMAGTGDLKTFRYLRRLHGRTDAETPYGSHFAAHLAIGVLFLAGGTYTFGTSNLAVASLLCAFYPLFPTDVHDNHVHLQAFRHLWVFAAEARCLVVGDIDTQRPLAMPITVTMKDGSAKDMTSPCLLPELNGISTVRTTDRSFWQVTLDFANNPKHLAHFQETQRISVRRCPPSEAHKSTFTATMAALTDVQGPSSSKTPASAWHGIFDLPSLRAIDKAETELVLPPQHAQSAVSTDEHGTSVDERLVLAQAAEGAERDALWNLRMLFAWAEKEREDRGGVVGWMGDEVLETLKARIEERVQGSGGE